MKKTNGEFRIVFTCPSCGALSICANGTPDEEEVRDALGMDPWETLDDKDDWVATDVIQTCTSCGERCEVEMEGFDDE